MTERNLETEVTVLKAAILIIIRELANMDPGAHRRVLSKLDGLSSQFDGRNDVDVSGVLNGISPSCKVLLESLGRKIHKNGIDD